MKQDRAASPAHGGSRAPGRPIQLRRLNRMMIFGISLGVLWITGVKFWPEAVKLRRLQLRTEALKIREDQLRFTRDRLREEYLRLQDDPEYLELVARDRLDLLRPGETVFRFVERNAGP